MMIKYLKYNIITIYKRYIHAGLHTKRRILFLLSMRGNDVVLELNEELCQVLIMK
jgi:hypothetical protein